ncbi:MAG TPA: AmmeMemoRadiSam system protein A [Candidatus Acidoferrales bacterium]|nr:AmmeMemoRadiSam system protein A [Candidatus Acidoferrales bacterium]
MSPLSSEDRRSLLGIARRAIVEAVTLSRMWEPGATSAALAERRGAFVTLKRHGALRGCVGQPIPLDPLAHTVAACAVLAAREDTRFAPVQPDEIGELTVEISALSPMEPILPEQIEIGRHGLWIEAGRRRGLLLPQVAVEHGFTPERFLAETCAKAGLPPDTWKSLDTRISGFTAEIFSDEDAGKDVPTDQRFLYTPASPTK